jgi:hypothetical protein
MPQRCCQKILYATYGITQKTGQYQAPCILSGTIQLGGSFP